MGSLVSVDIDALILGRELSYPIHGTDGVKLISAGVTLTPELKHRLIARGVRKVVIDESDAESATLNSVEADDETYRELERQLDERLDKLLRSGAMSIRNCGPAVRKEIARHGCKIYDVEHQREMADESARNAQAVDGFLDRAGQGEAIETDEMRDVADSCIRNLVADIDGTLDAALGREGEASIGAHSLQMATLAMSMAVEMGLDADNLQLVGLAALLADLGMSGVREEVLQAARPLTPVEFHEIQKHSIRTANLLERLDGLAPIIQIIAYQVHERLDGSGYPRGRVKASIHPFARLLHVADAYVAMTSSRPFRPPMMPYAAMESLLRQTRQGRVEEAAMRALLHVVSLFPIGSYVTLSDGSAAKVLRSNVENYTRPIVARVTDPSGGKIDPQAEDAILDLAGSELDVIQALPRPGAPELAIDVRIPGHEVVA